MFLCDGLPFSFFTCVLFIACQMVSSGICFVSESIFLIIGQWCSVVAEIAKLLPGSLYKAKRTFNLEP